VARGSALAELVLVVEALGRKLAPEPIAGALAMGGFALALGGSPALKAAWLPAVLEGRKVVALAHQEPSARYDLALVATRAEAKGSGHVLSGRKAQVLDAVGADAVIVPARTSGKVGDRDGITLFLVEQGAPGLTVERQAPRRWPQRGPRRPGRRGLRPGVDRGRGRRGGEACSRR
jgi:alkylation response protein AidB-like acyl-CoA dehydrogenase